MAGGVVVIGTHGRETSVVATIALASVLATVARADLLCGSLSGTLTIVGSPHVVTCDITVDSPDSLIVEPGVELRFQAGTSFTISGSVDVQGTGLLPVLFLSDSATPAPGDWSQFTVNGTATASSLVVRNGTRVVVAGAASFTDGAFDGLSDGVIYELGSSGSMLRGEVMGCDRGILVRSSAVSLDGVTFDANSVPVLVDVDAFPQLANLAASNSAVHDGVELETSAPWTQGGMLANAGLPYVVNGYMRLAPGTTLTLSEGVVFKLGDSAALSVSGFVANGTGLDPVWLVHLADDTVMGDTNRDGTATVPGTWGYLTVNRVATATSLIARHAEGVDLFGDASFTDCVFEELGTRIAFHPGSSGSITGGTVSGGDPGVSVGSSPVQLVGVAFEGNTVPVEVIDNYPVLSNLTATGSTTYDAVLLAGSWSESGTLLDAGLPYVVDESWLVAPGANLRLDPGVTVKVAGTFSLLRFEGAELMGSPGSPVVITSIADDSAYGDTNRDGPSAAAPGDWGTLLLRGPTTTATSTVMRGAEVIEVQGRATLADGAVEDVTSGVVLSSPVSCLLRGVSFARCGVAANVITSAAALEDCSFTDCSLPVRIAANAFPRLTGLTATGSRIVDGVLVDTSVPWTSSGTWTAADIPYVLRESLDLTDGNSLSIEGGAVLKFDPAAGGSGMSVPALATTGSLGTPVTFASLFDDAVAGDTNRDGTATLPAAGDWSGVELRGGDSAILGARITHADVGVRATDGRLAFRDGLVRHGRVGLAFDAAALGEVTGSTFQNLGTGVLAENSAAPDLGKVGDAVMTNDGGNMFGCNLWHVDNRTGVVVQAEANWWADDPPEQRLFLGPVDVDPFSTGPVRPEIDRLRLALSAGRADVNIAWDDLGPTCGYRVFRSGRPDVGFVDLSGWTASTSFADTAAGTDGRTWFYDVVLE